MQKRIKYNHLPSNYSTFKIWRTQIAVAFPFQICFLRPCRPVSYLEISFLLPSRKDIKDISIYIYITVKFKAMCTGINWILLSKTEFFSSCKSCHSTADDKLLFFSRMCAGAIIITMELSGGFLCLPGWHQSKKGRHQGCTCSWTLQVGKNSQYEFLVSILTGLKCGQFYNIWSLVLCRLSDTGFCRNSSSAT